MTECGKLTARHSVTADIEGTDDEYIVGAKAGYAIVNKQTGELRYIKKYWDDQEKEDRYPNPVTLGPMNCVN